MGETKTSIISGQVQIMFHKKCNITEMSYKNN